MNKYQSHSKARLSEKLIDPVEVFAAVQKDARAQHRRAFSDILKFFSPRTQPESFCMDRIDHLIDTFRVDHPEVDATLLVDFAQHVRRVLIDELREEMKVSNVPVQLSMQLHGQSFSAKGPRSYVEALLAGWVEAASAPSMKTLTPNFNRMKLISGSASISDL